jgi:hypothetical protein
MKGYKCLALCMSAYYDSISRAVAALNESTATARHALYDRARAALAEQIRTAGQSIERKDSDRAILALEEAIRRVEQEITSRQTSIKHPAIAGPKPKDAEKTKELPPESLSSNLTRAAIFKRILTVPRVVAAGVCRSMAEARATTIDCKLHWATNFFIWSALILLLFEVRPVFNGWSRDHTPQVSSVDATAQFIGYMTRGLVLGGSPYVLALINGLALRHYKSRLSAALFAVFGLIGLGLGMLVLVQTGIVYMSVASIVFFGVYLAIAVWTYDALTHRKHRESGEEADESSTEDTLAS